MAGLLSQYLGKNDAYKWLDQNRNALAQGFAGITGATDFGKGAQGLAYGAMNGAQTDQINQKAIQDKADEQAKIQKAADNLRNQFNRPDLADAIVNGGLGVQEAFNAALTKTQAPTPTDDMQNWEYNQTHPGFLEAMNGGSAQAPTLTSIYDENGREQKGYMQGGQFVPVGSPKANTERPEFNANQATAAGYADRMATANQILSNPDLAAVQTDAGQKIKSGTPLIGNMLTSKEFQQADQAQRDFINAILRRESGAVISDSEYASASQQYFPQPGDGPEVLAQKAQNRQIAIAGVARSAGPAYNLPGQPPPIDAPPAAAGGLQPGATYIYNPATGQLEAQ